MRRKKAAATKLVAMMIMLLSLLAGCGTGGLHLAIGNNTETGVPEGTAVPSEVPTEETTVEKTTTEAPTTEAPTTEAPTTEASTPETLPETPDVRVIEVELSADEMKTPIHTFSWGEGSGQVGFWDSDVLGKIGPGHFAVEDGTICVTDNGNFRVLIYENGEYTEIDTSQFGIVSDMKYQNQLIGVMKSSSNGMTGIYRKDGTLVKLIEHSKMAVDGLILHLVEVGENYVVWATFTANRYISSCYRYDWEKDSLEKLGDWEYSLVELNAPVNRNSIEVAGIDEDAVFYGYADINNWEYVVNKEADGYRWYAKIDISAMRSYPLQNIYYSEDGKFYVMECREENVVISEIKFREGQ